MANVESAAKVVRIIPDGSFIALGGVIASILCRVQKYQDKK